MVVVDGCDHGFVVLDDAIEDHHVHELDAVGHHVQVSVDPVVVLLLLDQGHQELVVDAVAVLLLLDQDHHELVVDAVAVLLLLDQDHHELVVDDVDTVEGRAVEVIVVGAVGMITRGGIVGEPLGRMVMSEQPINVSFSRPSPGPD